MELKRARADVELRDRESAGGTPTEIAKAKARGRRAAPPMLSPSSDKLIDVSFPPDTNIKKIYNALCASAGINVIFDPQLKDDKFTLDLRGMTFQRALEVAMRQAGHFYKVLDERTIIIAQDTQQNRREYEDLVIRTFFLSNGDVKDVSGMVRAVLDMRRLQPVPQLNAIVIRDTADKVAVAERLIEETDKAKAEVIVDVELLLIGRNNLLDLGMLLSQYSTTATVIDAAGAAVGSMTWNQIKNLGINDISFTLPTVTFNFLKQNTDAQVLAKPQLRIAEGEKAQLVIGDRVPIPVSTYNTTQSVGQIGVVPITSFQYQDVGIKVEIEPRVHHNKEVSMKLLLEISNINGYVTQPGGPSMPQIGTRTINTTIRLKDGETNFLAGLVRRDQTQTKDKIPFLSDIPLLGTLFTHYKNSDQTTDIFMTLTPHIIRAPQITEEDLLPIWVGTENNVSFSGQGTRLESPSAAGSPFDGGARAVPAQPPRSQAPVPAFGGSAPTDLFRQSTPQSPAASPTPAPSIPLGAPGIPVLPTPPPGNSSLKTSPESEKTASVMAAAASAPVSSTTAVSAAKAAVLPGSPEFSLLPSSTTLAPGEAAKVSLVGESGLSDARLLEVNVEWNPEVTEVTGIAPGPWSDGVGANLIRFDADRVAGRARIQMLRRDGDWGIPSGPLAIFSIRGASGGTAFFRASAGNVVTKRGSIPPVVNPAAVTVSAGS